MSAGLEKGLIEIYTGNGKGKSTAAFGLALRASGQGMKVRMIQFMKKGEYQDGVNYGEINALNKIPGIDVSSFGSMRFIVKGKLANDDICLAKEALEAAKAAMDGKYDLLILDEVLNALYFELITEKDIRDLLSKKPERLEIVLTGRNAPQYLIDLADLVTEMKEVKHPFEKNIKARRGIEY